MIDHFGIRTFDEFVQAYKHDVGPIARSLHVEHPGFSTLYVRRAHRLRRERYGVDFVIASVDAVTPGQGALTRLLDEYEPRYGLMFESTINYRLVKYLMRRGYVVSPTSPIQSPDLYRWRPACPPTASPFERPPSTTR